MIFVKEVVSGNFAIFTKFAFNQNRLEQMGLGRSATWICQPCPCPPRTSPPSPCPPCHRVEEVAWLRGEEKDRTEEEGLFVAHNNNTGTRSVLRGLPSQKVQGCE